MRIPANLREFAAICWKEITKEIFFFHISFWCLQPAHYLLHSTGKAISDDMMTYDIHRCTNSIRNIITDGTSVSDAHKQLRIQATLDSMHECGYNKALKATRVGFTDQIDFDSTQLPFVLSLQILSWEDKTQISESLPYTPVKSARHEIHLCYPNILRSSLEGHWCPA